MRSKSHIAARGHGQRPRRRFSARPFYLTILVILFLTVITQLSRSSVWQSNAVRSLNLEKRQAWSVPGSQLLKRGEEVEDQCRRVHDVKDQCAFIKTNCPDHEVGLLSYLRLYYCKLDQAKALAFTILVVWLSLLFSTIGIAASDFLCINLSTIANFLGMSESLTGVTFLAFGNGSPDVFSTFAAMGSNSGGMAVGELIGAAGFITAVVAGSMALVRPFKVARRSFVRDVGFFVVATSFSMVFLADGELHVWECATMVAFYIFYVFTVVTWHWYLGRMRQKREREFAARAHFHIPENQELDIEEFSDDEDRVAGAGETRSLLHGASTDDFGALEAASPPAWKEDNEDDETRDRYLAELRGNMRVSRAAPGERRSTINPIRPSLVGALEFRSVLSSLQRSRNIHDSPIILRRYSDDPNHPDNLSVVSSPNIVQPARHQTLQPSRGPDANRARAVSANDAARYQLAPGFPNGPDVPSIDLLVSSPPRENFEEQPNQGSADQAAPAGILQRDLLHASPTSSGYPSRESSPARGMGRSVSPDRLAPPGTRTDFRETDYRADRGRHIQLDTAGVSPGTVPPPQLQPRRSTMESGSMSPPSPFPAFSDTAGSVSSRAPSIRLSPPSVSADSVHTHDHFPHLHEEAKPLSWWPYKVLPRPEILVSTLFPTLYGWSSKSVWDKFLGMVAAPSVFLLTITLPVVEPQQPEDTPEIDSGILPEQLPNGSSPGALLPLTPDSPLLRPEGDRPETNGEDLLSPAAADQPKPATTPYTLHRHDSEAPALPPVELQQNSSSPKEWNRWLVAIQLFTAPLLITIILWTNFDEDLNPHNLLIPTLSSLLFSLVCLAALLLSTKNNLNKMPTHMRPLFAFLGFIVSIAWISTLATEVVNLLKTLGVILSISDSLLGLTVFAVGNSLGDLVADITVARLGYPVMALSACFGGPMLNILLGVGVGGLYMTLHNDSSSTSSLFSTSDPSSSPLSTLRDPYRISVSKTLLISGAVLLLTLTSLLIFVPLNGWRMDRKIGWGLVTLWCLSTIGNVVVEVTTS
ncbi:hypothetical protein FQN54_000618 [Arachnomyces sp. PD_36]|nr:hypothetical protein FQN54_000618 [Arachnomyces sp. PD_36]